MLDKTFIRYIKEHKDFTKIILILAIGIILIVIGVSNNDDKDVNEVSDLEKQLSDLCSSVEGVGECRVLIYYSEENTRYNTKQKVESIVVVCEGADSLSTRKQLTDMLSSFFGIGSNRVRIEKMAK